MKSIAKICCIQFLFAMVVYAKPAVAELCFGDEEPTIKEVVDQAAEDHGYPTTSPILVHHPKSGGLYRSVRTGGQLRRPEEWRRSLGHRTDFLRVINDVPEAGEYGVFEITFEGCGQSADAYARYIHPASDDQIASLQAELETQRWLKVRRDLERRLLTNEGLIVLGGLLLLGIAFGVVFVRRRRARNNAVD